MPTPIRDAHPSRALLAAQVSGWIAPPADLCVRVHLETCPACRRKCAVLGAAEADFVDSLPEAPVDSDMLHHLARRMAAMPAAPAPAAKALGDVELPRALWDAEIAPRRWVRPGFWVAHLPAWRDDDWHVYLLRAPAGQKLPAHGHAGPELLCVLKGACVDGRRRQAGDFVENPTGSHHHLAVTSDGPCACLIATKGALVWRGAARLLGPAYSV